METNYEYINEGGPFGYYSTQFEELIGRILKIHLPSEEHILTLSNKKWRKEWAIMKTILSTPREFTSLLIEVDNKKLTLTFDNRMCIPVSWVESAYIKEDTTYTIKKVLNESPVANGPGISYQRSPQFLLGIFL